MIQSAQIRNFRCLRNVDIDFEPLTVLVGPNAVGKSSLIAALDLGTKWTDRDHWRQREEYRPAAEMRHNTGTAKRQSNGYAHGKRYDMQTLHLDLKAIRAANQVREERRLKRHGDNLSNVFDTLSRSEQGQVAKDFASLVPVLADVAARPGQSGHHRLVFQDRWRPEIWYEPDEVSDGTMLVLAFLVAQHQLPQVDILAVEEPERALHPYLLGQLMELFRGMATGKIGPRPVQIILATHSVELLEFAKPEEVRFLSRNDEGEVGVEAAPTETPEWEEAIREYERSMGQMWLSGSLGGVPAT